MDSRFGFRFSSANMRSESSLSLGERLCAVFFPFVAIAEAVFFTITDCLADLCPGSDSSAYGAAASSFSTAKRNRSYHHHYRTFLRRDDWTSLDLRSLARLADESRCCKNPIYPPYLLAGRFVRHFLAMPFDLTPSCAHSTEPSHGERGGGALRALEEDQLLHHRRRPHPQGRAPAGFVQNSKWRESFS